MILYIRLLNPDVENVSIANALRKTDLKVQVEDGHITLITETLVEGQPEFMEYPFIHEIWHRTHEVIAIINGAAAIEGASINRLELNYVDYVAKDGGRKPMPNVATADIVLPALRAGAPDPASFISLAFKDLAAAKALRLCVPNSDWVNLYRLYEIVKEDVPKHYIHKAGWASVKEIKAFTYSANDPAVTGDFSRHGPIGKAKNKSHIKKKHIKICAPTITLNTARNLIKRLLREWLAFKCMQKTII